MKKTLILFSCLAALYSCSDELESDRKSAPAQMTINATFEDQSGSTRTSLGTDNTVVWDQGDVLSVFDFNEPPTNSQFTLTSGAGTTSGTFSGTGVKSSTGYFAVYPYSSDLKFTYDTDPPKGDIGVRSLILTTQYARKGSIPTNIPMVAYAAASDDDEGPISLNFKNVFAYLKFNLNYICKSVTIEPNASDESLTPRTFHVALAADGIPYMHDISFLQDKNHEVTLVNQDGSDLQPGTYYVAVYPQMLSEGFKMTFTSTSDPERTISQSTSKSVTLKRNTILNLGTIDITNLSCLDGDGTFEEPYLINDYSDLYLLSAGVKYNRSDYTHAYFKQTAAIDMGGNTLPPIGTSEHPFAGIYEGCGLTISNGVWGVTDDVSALFAYIGNTTDNVSEVTTICNVVVDNCCPDASATSISPLVGKALRQCNIINCHAKKSDGTAWVIHSDKTHNLGGILASCNSMLSMKNCSNSIDVFCQTSGLSSTNCFGLGGLIGYVACLDKGNSTTDDAIPVIDHCRNTGNIEYYTEHNALRLEIGGIIGLVQELSSTDDVACRILNCVNAGDISVTMEAELGDRLKTFNNYGGIVGYMNSNGFDGVYPKIFNCLNKGDLTTNRVADISPIAGLCYGDETSIDYCVNIGTITSVDGWRTISSGGTPTGCYSTSGKAYDGVEIVDASSLTNTFMNAAIPDSYRDAAKAAGFTIANWKGTAADGSLDLDF